jgi:Ca2+-binding RTX toxin-like protein
VLFLALVAPAYASTAMVAIVDSCGGDVACNKYNGGQGVAVSSTSPRRVRRTASYGYGAADDLRGGAGRDRLSGGGGTDRLAGGSGRDFLLARDGRRDRVDCGAGRDRARTDAKDRVLACETSRSGVYTSSR